MRGRQAKERPRFGEESLVLAGWRDGGRSIAADQQQVGDVVDTPILLALHAGSIAQRFVQALRLLYLDAIPSDDRDRLGRLPYRSSVFVPMAASDARNRSTVTLSWASLSGSTFSCTVTVSPFRSSAAAVSGRKPSRPTETV